MVTKRLLSCVMAAAVVATTARAEVRFATVDLNRVFEAYYKTAEAKERVSEMENSFNRERRLRMEDYQKMVEEWQKLKDDSENPGLSEENRTQKKKSLVERGKAVEELEADIRKFDAARRADIQKTMVRMRNNIVEEITAVISKFSQEKGFTLVLDSSGQSINGAPFVLFAESSLDVTDGIVKILNSTKGTAAAAPPGKKDEKKTPKASADRLDGVGSPLKPSGGPAPEPAAEPAFELPTE